MILQFFISVNARVKPSDIDSLIKAYVSINKFNGSALVIKNGEIFFEKGYGYQNVSTKQPNTRHSIFPIGSLTKSFTALIVLKLAEGNKLSLEEPISNYIPHCPNGGRIKIKHLLTNSGGIYEKFRNPDFYARLSSTNNYGYEEKMAFF